MERQKDRDPSQPTRVVEGRREGLGLAQIARIRPKSPRWRERRAQGEAEIDGLLPGVTRLRQMREGLSACSK